MVAVAGVLTQTLWDVVHILIAGRLIQEVKSKVAFHQIVMPTGKGLKISLEAPGMLREVRDTAAMIIIMLSM